jgi:Zn-dependent protease
MADAEKKGPRGGFYLGRVFGVEVVADWSVGIIFVLVAANLGMGVFPEWHPEWSPLLVWTVAIGAAFLFFVSLLAHELSHALVGRVFGVSVRRITLFIFGGMAHMDNEPPSPKSELWMAAAGPAMSLGLGVAATVGAWFLGSLSVDATAADPTAALAQVGPVATLLLWLGPINIMLGVFNLVPGFPLDGGRVFRAIVWAVTGDLTKATRWASFSGQAFAAILMAFGITALLRGAFGQGIWLLLIGWFLMNAAKSSLQQTLLTRALEGVRVLDVMRRRPLTVSPGLPVSELVSDRIMATDARAFPVLDPDGLLVGLVTLTDVRKVARDEWLTTAVAAIMTKPPDLLTLPVTASATEALEALGKKEVNQLPVVDGAALVGMVSREDIVRWLSLQDLARQPTRAHHHHRYS